MPLGGILLILTGFITGFVRQKLESSYTSKQAHLASLDCIISYFSDLTLTERGFSAFFDIPVKPDDKFQDFPSFTL
jgi:hypothetical protein